MGTVWFAHIRGLPLGACGGSGSGPPSSTVLPTALCAMPLPVSSRGQDTGHREAETPAKATQPGCGAVGSGAAGAPTTLLTFVLLNYTESDESP